MKTTVSWLTFSLGSQEVCPPRRVHLQPFYEEVSFGDIRPSAYRQYTSVLSPVTQLILTELHGNAWGSAYFLLCRVEFIVVYSTF